MWWMLAGMALADRPDEGGGLFVFDDTDVLAYTDGPTRTVRVHYSVEGPNVTLLADEDGSGAPDFAETVAETAEDVLRFYEDLGFEPPLTEADLGLGDLGGSPAFDFYLVDFGGNADGAFSIDGCAGQQCAGHMIMENDFQGYGYPSLEEAASVLCSHELFHAVQAAYIADQPVWFSEGTAVWAENQYDPGVQDFLRLADAYLAETNRSLDRPPAGAVTAFSYGTALFFQFLTERFGEGVGPDLQQTFAALGPDGALDAILEIIETNRSSIEEEWARFARWNLATGRRAGDESYPFAPQLSGIVVEASAEEQLIDDNRFYPLAASYFRVGHPGGELRFSSTDDLTGLTFSLHPEGEAALEIWSPIGPDARAFPDLPAGSYWLVGTYPTPAEQSVKAEFCLGIGCSLDVEDPAEDTASDDEMPPVAPGCATSGAAVGAWWVGVIALARVRRRD